jgi:fucose 4-O-acetylase-like acetyltransferase
MNSPQAIKATRRYGWIDYARGISILLIVCSHMTRGLVRDDIGTDVLDLVLRIPNSTVFARMPLFFMVSGIFMRQSLEKRKLKTFVQYKAATILYPYLIWGSIHLGVQIIGSMLHVTNSERTLADFWYLLYNPHKIDQFWFLYALFNASMLYLLANALAKGRAWLMLALGTGSYILSYYAGELIADFTVKASLEFFFYTALGDATAQWFLSDRYERIWSSWWLFFLNLPFFLLLHYQVFHYHEIMADSHVLSLERLWRMAAVLSGLLFIFNVSFILSRLNAFDWLRYIGKHSLYIYVMHVMAGGLTRGILVKLGMAAYPVPLLILVVSAAVFVPIAVYQIAMRLGFSFLFNYPGDVSGKKTSLASRSA